MNEGEVLVVGGTSDARALCRQLGAANVAYTLSVATPAGKALAGDIKGQVRCGRLEYGQMVACTFRRKRAPASRSRICLWNPICIWRCG